jgi:hypothetical protein
MKERILKTLDGREVKKLIPENEEDLRYIATLIEEGKVDCKASFGDYKHLDKYKALKKRAATKK